MTQQIFKKGGTVTHCFFRNIDLYITDVNETDVKVLYLANGEFKVHVFKIEDLEHPNGINQMGGNFGPSRRGEL